MFRSHTEIAKLFRHDSASGTYFYHQKDKWVAGGEVFSNNEWVQISEEVYDYLRRDAWREYKSQERANKCRDINGVRCTKNCKDCPKSRDGRVLSLEQLIELGGIPEDTISIDDPLANKELCEAIHIGMQQLNEREKLVVRLYTQGYVEREIAKLISCSQKSVNNWKRSAFAKLRRFLEEYY